MLKNDINKAQKLKTGVADGSKMAGER